jgi:hypothetical protein
MSNISKSGHCAVCGNAFPVVEGRTQQWRVAGNEFTCSEFCAEGVESRQTGARDLS